MVPLRNCRRQREARTGQGKESRMLCKSLVTAAITLRRALLMAQQNRHGLRCGDFRLFTALLPNLRLRS